MEAQKAEISGRRRKSNVARAALVLLVVGVAAAWLLTGGTVKMEEWQARRVIKEWVSLNVADSKKTEVLYISNPGMLVGETYRFVKVRVINSQGDQVHEEVLLRYTDGRPAQAMSVKEFTSRVSDLHPSAADLRAMSQALEEMANHPAAIREP